MSTHMPGFQSVFSFLHHFLLAKLATSSVRVNPFLPSSLSEMCCLVVWQLSEKKLELTLTSQKKLKKRFVLDSHQHFALKYILKYTQVMNIFTVFLTTK